jgi:two-component system, OmpR family, sensor histidine kinase KdpD
MDAMPRLIRVARVAAPIVVALVIATAAIAVLEGVGDVPDASATYLVAVVLAGVLYGTRAAVACAVGAFVLYDVLFVEPRNTLLVADTAELLDLLLLLFVGVVVGRLAGTQRDRTAASIRREREARALSTLSRTLAVAPSTTDALAEVVHTLVNETRFDRVVLVLAPHDERIRGERERVVADTDPALTFPETAVSAVLQRRPGDQPAEWALVHAGAAAVHGRRAPRAAMPYIVGIDVPAGRLGWIRAVRGAGADAPSVEETRLLAAAADQIGRGLERDRLAEEATTAEIARRSDALKSALLDSVSHELRTPLAAIRAAAGTLADPDVEWPASEVRTSAASIDREAERLAQLVGNLLDVGRIEGGALHPVRAPFVLGDLVHDAVERSRAMLGGRPLTTDIPDELPAVLVDAVYVELVLRNTLENAARYTPEDAPVRVVAWATGDAVTLRVEDGGTGVPEAALPQLFDKFYRVPRANEAARRGTGIGLTVVRGLVEAMGGRVSAGRSVLGGLAIDVSLPIAPSERLEPRPAVRKATAAPRGSSESVGDPSGEPGRDVSAAAR